MRGITRAAVAVAAVSMPAVLFAVPAQAAPKAEAEVGAQHFACGSGVRPNRDPISAITGASSGARIRTGSATSCTAPGSIQPSDQLDYYCYTLGNDGYTWTYLRNRRTGVQGWTRDDLLPGGGSNYGC
ncbi:MULTISPECIES: SH3 domain-containing protein [Actinosynnema]|uniref:SH3 domain-containing protein n=1 Tax=Actinosynnema TaxID=40566 RepID=UPI0020A2CB75|nr:SH3 domain-containing protein [Actinosynnema pretiosum]MCP2098524.1 hypothetical protein [Actinosynnema pretiosum]